MSYKDGDEMTGEHSNGTRYPTWQVIAAVLISILIGLTGYMFAGMATAIADLSRQKLDKEVYFRDMDRLQRKMDKVLDILIEHERDTQNQGQQSRFDGKIRP